MKKVVHLIFGLGLGTAFWQYFEWGYALWQAGLQSSPIWSGTLGAPLPHHGYWGFVMVLFSYLYVSREDLLKCCRVVRRWLGDRRV